MSKLGVIVKTNCTVYVVETNTNVVARSWRHKATKTRDVQRPLWWLGDYERSVRLAMRKTKDTFLRQITFFSQQV